MDKRPRLPRSAREVPPFAGTPHHRRILQFSGSKPPSAGTSCPCPRDGLSSRGASCPTTCRGGSWPNTSRGMNPRATTRSLLPTAFGLATRESRLETPFQNVADKPRRYAKPGPLKGGRGQLVPLRQACITCRGGARAGGEPTSTRRSGARGGRTQGAPPDNNLFAGALPRPSRHPAPGEGTTRFLRWHAIGYPLTER